jgi:thiosulfate/3-mercaptopyruvate sulfurtransferase
VSTDWVEQHRKETDRYRVVESDEDVLLYETGHVPEAVKIDWVNDLNHPVVRDYIDADHFASLCSKHGIGNDTTVVFYGDKNNWWACYAFWVFQLHGHLKAKVMDGGRIKWQKEGRPLTREVPTNTPTSYRAPGRHDALHRVFRDEVGSHVAARGQMVDVRSPEEYTGQRLHMPDYPNEGALRGGHIPGAKSIPWARAILPEDGTFRPARELRAIYVDDNALDPKKATIAYCRIGERSSHTWFALKYLLGFEQVRNYDGSWTEWGNLVNVPIERP